MCASTKDDAGSVEIVAVQYFASMVAVKTCAYHAEEVEFVSISASAGFARIACWIKVLEHIRTEGMNYQLS